MTLSGTQSRVHTAQQRSGPWLRANLWWYAGPVALAAAVLPILGHPSLAEDEASSLAASNRSVPQILHLAKNADAGNNGYYVLLHLWTSVFGQSDVMLRLPSWIALAVTSVLISVLARDIAGRAAGLYAGLLFVLFPITPIIGQTARPAALGIFFTALALLSLRRAWTTGRAGWWAAYFVSILCLCYATLLGAGVVIGLVPFVVIGRQWRRVGLWLIGTTAALLLAFPVILLSYRQRAIQSWITAVPWGGVPAVWAQTTGTTVLTALLVGAALAAWALGRRDGALIWGSLLAVPVSVTALSHISQPVLISRYLEGSLVPLAVLGGITLAALKPRAALVSMAVVLILVTVPQQIEDAHLSTYGADYRAAARVIKAHLEPGDAIVYGDWGPYPYGIEHYLGPQAPDDVMRVASGASSGTLYGLGRPDSDIPAAVKGHRRVWYVAPPGTVYPRGALLAPLYPKTTSYDVTGVMVTLYQR